MKKLLPGESHTLTPLNKAALTGKPPKGMALNRPALTSSDVDLALHRDMMDKRVFKETTAEDFKRIQAELKYELGKV